MKCELDLHFWTRKA